MSSEYALKITEEQAMEMPMVDLAFLILKATNNPLNYRELMAEIAKIKGYGDEEVNQVISQLYTEINIDGRFACVGPNLWGLKRWYPVEKAEDPVGGGRPRIINDDDDDLDDEDLFEEEAYEEDEDEDYNLDEDADELFDDDEEVPEMEDDMDEELDEDIIEETDDAEMEDEDLDEDDYDSEDDTEIDEDEDDDK
ncbi:DNA-directed RNA polymerase subunit delta [Ferviditalea candida]|uniref:Probable DNA-directed RNA polymerase subunit delta n=1 Tax=Ferviditalea candida TaxID=3108399 RepID=A0ABU5ZH80_9BACL|nr:DNA-directed RNA polymerase subunit delta [Paenibacillaceae bacterium T2]